MNRKSPKQIEKLAKAVARGSSLQHAMLQGGYSASTARRGRAALSQPMWEALARESNKLELLGRKLNPERQENLIRGRLVQNVITGKDDAVQSAKQLGSDKRISTWQPESTANLIVLQAPPIRQVNHPVPLLPSKHPEDLE